jgi:hypothetical protein
MATDAATNTITVASLTEEAAVGGEPLAVSVACKMVNRARVTDELGLALQAGPASCQKVNELTYKLALSTLEASARKRFLEKGTPLIFIEDYLAPAGGAWLASAMSDYITHSESSAGTGQLTIQAPSVQVEWPEQSGDWFQGTHHCKLITLAAMTRWMQHGAFDGSTELYPRPKPRCVKPDGISSEVGSCLQYFGPAGAQFCQDYSGSGWTTQSAREDCLIRHSSLDAWNRASDSYDGGGGIFSESSCEQRDVTREARLEPVNQPAASYQGTCVFRCNTADEALWHQLTPMAGDTDGRMLEKTCDLYLELDWE